MNNPIPAYLKNKKMVVEYTDSSGQLFIYRIGNKCICQLSLNPFFLYPDCTSPDYMVNLLIGDHLDDSKVTRINLLFSTYCEAVNVLYRIVKGCSSFETGHVVKCCYYFQSAEVED